MSRKDDRDINSVLDALKSGTRATSGLSGRALNEERARQTRRIKTARPRRSGLVIAITLLTLGALSVGGYFAITAVIKNREQNTILADQQLNPDHWQIGDHLKVSTSVSFVNIRRQPGYISKPEDDIVDVIPTGMDMAITDVPTSRDSLIWWPVVVDGNGGWIATRTESGRQILIGTVPDH